MLLGFLWYNTYPAEIFMGDVGALSLGAGLALMALMARQELLLIIAGGIFVMETLSVIIQVASFKLLGRRVFKMAPIHHHFEIISKERARAEGRSPDSAENSVVIRFWIVSIVCALLGLATLKLR